MLVRVRDGRIVSIEGDPLNTATRGTGSVLEALAGLDLLVVVDRFMTDTARVFTVRSTDCRFRMPPGRVRMR
jgi:predicted molibdopterin-dependent oxidoreductase YjgC